MTGHRRLGKSGQRRIRHAARALEAIGDAAQARPEHHPHVGIVDGELLAGGLRRALNPVEEGGVQFHDGRASVGRVEERRHRVQEGSGRLDVRQVPGLRDRHEARARDRFGDLLHLRRGRHLVLGPAHDQRRAGDRAQLGGPVGAVAERLDAGAQAGGARLGAREHVSDARGRRLRRQQPRQGGAQVGHRSRAVDRGQRGGAGGPRLGAVGGGARVRQDQRREPIAVARRERQRRVAAHRHADHGRARDRQAIEQRRQVVGEIRDRERTGRRRITEPVRVDGDHPAVRRQRVGDARPRRARQRERVQQDRRGARAAIVVTGCRHHAIRHGLRDITVVPPMRKTSRSGTVRQRISAAPAPSLESRPTRRSPWEEACWCSGSR